MAAPKGNKNAAKAKTARVALEAALARKSGKKQRKSVESFECLVNIWEKQIDMALDGDVNAAKEIFNRLDGKPAQAIDIGGQEDNPIKTDSKITFVGMSNER